MYITDEETGKVVDLETGRLAPLAQSPKVQIATSEQRYLTTAETAKLIRAQLKVHFPGTKFSVRSSVYSMGSSVSIHWTDGPTKKAVNLVVGPFAGRDFDGMIDLEYSVWAWLLPDGSAEFAYSSGTEGSMGVHSAFENPKPHPDAELVHMGAGYVHTTRHYSAAVYRAALESVAKLYRLPMPELKTHEDGEPYITSGVYDADWFHTTGDYPAGCVWRELKDKTL